MTELEQKEHLIALQERLGHSFLDTALLERALTHRSLQSQGTGLNYERLEFIGDAVFDLVVAELLHRKRPDALEGELTKIRAAFVREESLAKMAQELMLGQEIRMSKSEQTLLLFNRPSILADVMEAVVGAVFLDGGYTEAQKLVVKLVEPLLDTNPEILDPKSQLQEWLQRQGKPTPVYKTEQQIDSGMPPIFQTSVEFAGETVGTGLGTTKKISQQEAAANALKLLQERRSQNVSPVTVPISE